MSQTITNALSVDLEDWFHAELVRTRIEQRSPTRRVEMAVQPFIDLFQRYGVKATFFVVGDVLRHHPALVRHIHQQGHEIGCHGWSHRPLWQSSPDDFSQELDQFDCEAGAVLPTAEIIGFRAPTFSLDRRTAWALDSLRSRGYRYDSSVFPVRNYLYGVDGCPSQPYRPTANELTIDHPGEDLVEFPMTVSHLAGLPVPVSGGFYLRAIPLWILLPLLAQVNAQGRPFVLYVHPWEADSHTPHATNLPLLHHLVTYYNADAVIRKLEVLLQRFRLAPLRQVLGLDQQRRRR